MTFFVSCFLAVTLPFLAERYYFKKRVGPFAALFWLFICQAIVLFGANLLIGSQLGAASPQWLATTAQFLTLITVLTIGIVPLISVVTAAFAVLILAFDRLVKRRT